MSAPLVLVPQYFGALVFDRRALRYLPFDHETAGLLIALQRDGIEAVLARTAPADREAVLGFIDHCHVQRFFRLDGRLAAEVREVDVPADHLVGPLVLHLEIIGACNLTCSHCFAGQLPRNHDPLSVAEMASLFAELSRLGTFRVGLTGGEPLLRRDVLDILDAALDAGLHPSLTTNAVLLTEELARELGRRQGFTLNVSLEGPSAEVNDAVRGAGTFAAVLDRLALLRRHARFSLGFTLMRGNVHLVRECVELGHQVGAQAVVFRPLYPAGMALHHLDLMPTFEQYQSALGELSAWQDPSSDLVSQTGPTCAAGQYLCSVSVQGDVNPCGFLGRAFETGNIREQPFEVIWRTGQAMRRMRKPGFRGGCRARALVLAGSVDADDPWMTAHYGGALHPCANLEVTSPRALPLPLVGG
jgi:radical SAM protein with 4Fe4S-binding SPASM domain